MTHPFDENRSGDSAHPQQMWQAPSEPFAPPPAQPYQQPASWLTFGPPPYANRSFRPVRGLGLAASILICAVVLSEALFAVSDWYTYRVVSDYVDGTVKDPSRLNRADLLGGVVASGYLLALAAAAVVFIVWLWRVRGNAEVFCDARHRRSRGWVIGGWFCPVVNLWFPKQIVDDVIAASDPRTPPRVPDLRGIRPHGLVLAWWITWLVSAVVGNVGGTDAASDVPDLGDQAVGANWSSVSAVMTAISAVLAIRVIRFVNRLQMSRPWTPWWATDPSAAPAAQYPYGQQPPWPAQ